MAALMVAVAGLGPATATFAAQASDSSAKVADGESVTEGQNRSMGNAAASECVAQGESGGDQFAVNKSSGFMGLFQIGEGKLIDLGYVKGVGNRALDNDNQNVTWTDKARAAGINSWDDFLANADFQRKAKAEIDDLVQGRLSSAAKGMVGSTIMCGGTPTTVTDVMLTQGAQFGEGKVNNWAKNGGNCVGGKGTATNDGNGKCVTWQMCNASNCSSVTKDMSKQTCSVTMPMIKNISCSNYTGENLALCNAAKPYLMTDAECASAEAFTKDAPKGPNKEKCENLTFGPGTGSWSFALACSWASEAVADQDGAANNVTSTTPDDPQCIAKLKSMGLNFTEQGSVSLGSSGGVPCVVASAVSSSGTTLPWGPQLQMDCNLLYAMETFSQKIKSLGVSSYYGVSTTSCRKIRNNRGTGSSMSWHSYGKAFDFSGVVIGGRKISMGNVNNPGTPDGQIALQIKSIACATFSGVLTPAWEAYKAQNGKDAFVHNHVDIGGKYCK